MAANMDGTMARCNRAEQDCLGSILLDESVLDIVADIVKPEDFYSEVNRLIYTKILELQNEGKPVDMANLYAKVVDSSALENAGGIHYVAALTQRLPTAANIKAYCKIIRSESIYRRLVMFARGVCNVNWADVPDPDAEVARLCEEMAQITNNSSVTPWKDFRTALQETYNNLMSQDGTMEIRTGFVDLDAKLALKPGTLTIVAARPAMGKTAFGLNVMSHIALTQNQPVAFFSLEMTSTELINRVVSALSSVNGTAIRQKRLSDAEWQRLLQVAEQYVNAPVYIDETPGIDIATLLARARRMKRQYNIQAIIIDYLQLMHADGKRIQNREQEVATISRGLKGLAKELRIPVIALAQLNRAVDSRAEKRPILSDLRESGSIEQDSDNILFLHREDYYRQDGEEDHIAEVIIAKQRSGSTGIVKLCWEKDFTRFSNLEQEF